MLSDNQDYLWLVGSLKIDSLKLHYFFLVFLYSTMDLYYFHNVKKVKVTQPCPTLCDPLDYTVRGILQARILEWVAFPFSRGSSQPRDQTQVSPIADGFFTS